MSGPAATGLQQALERLKFNVDSVDDIEEGARLLEQGVYEVAVTARTPPEPGKPETLAQRMLRLPLDARRRVFVILVGEEFRTADGTQAWAAQADLVVNPADAGRCEQPHPLDDGRAEAALPAPRRRPPQDRERLDRPQPLRASAAGR